MKKTIVSLAVMFFVVSISSVSLAVEIYTIETLDWGIYDLNKYQKAAPGKVSTAIVKLVKLTEEIPAKIGRSFGYRFYVNGHPPGAKVNLTLRWLYPYPGVKHPETGKLTHYSDEQAVMLIGQKNKGYYTHVFYGFAGLTFDRPSDLVPGEWTLQLWHGAKKLKEKKFTVYKP